MKYNCETCRDTGHRDQGGFDLNCTDCGVAEQRVALNLFAERQNGVSLYQTDRNWAIHQRALAMAADEHPMVLAAQKKADEEFEKYKNQRDDSVQAQAFAENMHKSARVREILINAQEFDLISELCTSSAAAPQVVADERALFEAVYPVPDGVERTYRGENLGTDDLYSSRYKGFVAEELNTQWKAWQGRAALAAAPVQAQEPVYQVSQPFPADPVNTWRDASADAYDLSHPDLRRILYHAPVQPVAVPDPLYQAMHDFRDDVLSGIDGLDNDQINAVLGTFDNYMLDEPAAPAAQGDAEKLLATFIDNVDTTGGWYIYFKEQPLCPFDGWEQAFDIDKWLDAARAVIAPKAAS